MDDSSSRGPGSGLRLVDVVDMLRDDAAAAESRSQRSLDDVERRLMAAIAEAQGTFSKYIDAHAGDHLAMRNNSEVAHARYDAFIASNAIDQARRDGALGVTRYAVDLLGRNWKALAAIAAAVAAASGNIHVSIGA